MTAMLERISELAAEGARIAVAPGGREWAVAEEDRVTLWHDGEPAGELPPARTRVLDLRYSADGGHILAAPERADTAAREWEALGDLRAELGAATPAGPRLAAAVWGAHGADLLVAAQEGNEQRVLLLD